LQPLLYFDRSLAWFRSLGSVSLQISFCMYDLAAILVTSPNIEMWNLRQSGLRWK
jgi:hypothetical protein